MPLLPHRPKPPGTTEALLEEISKKLTHSNVLLHGIYEEITGKFQSTTATLDARRRYVDMATTATLTFTDSSGNPASPPKGDGSGLNVVFSSDNPNVTLGTVTASGDTATAEITGTEAFDLSAIVSNQSGAELLDDDGVTAFVQPTSIPVAAAPPPQAVTATLSTE